MELDYLKSLIDTDFQKLYTEILALAPDIDHEKLRKQYDPTKHDIMNPAIYKDRKVDVTPASAPAETARIYEYVPVRRCALPEQQKIAKQQAMILVGNPVKMHAAPEENTKQQDLLDVMTKTRSDNKAAYKDQLLALYLFSQCHVAELYYLDACDDDYWKDTPNEGKLERVKIEIFANSKGDSLYPVKDRTGNLIAFGRGYTVKEEGKEVSCFDLYTDDWIYTASNKEGGKMALIAGEEGKIQNRIGKIGISYAFQPESAWAPAQPNISQLELSYSGHTNTNANNANPLNVVEGLVKSFPSGSDSSRVLEIDPGGKVYNVSWDQATESIELEQRNLREAINTSCGAIDISFDKLQKMGDYSSAALNTMFMPAYMKAAENEIVYGEGKQRAFNILKAAMAVINPDLKDAAVMPVTPVFTYFRPNNDLETINMLETCTHMSEETKIDLNPLIEDKQAEKDRLKAEREVALEQQRQQFSSPGGLDAVMGGKKDAA